MNPFDSQRETQTGPACGSDARAIGQVIVLAPDGERYEGESERIAPGAAVAHDVLRLLELARRSSRPMLLIHGGALSEDKFEIVDRLKDLTTRPSMALMSDAESFGATLTAARRLGVGVILPEFGWRRAAEWGQWLGWAAGAESPRSLAAILGQSGRVQTFEVRSRDDKYEVANRLATWMSDEDFASELAVDCRLILEELLNNALFHGFAADGGGDKYAVQSFETLEPDERVEVEFGVNGRLAGLSVRDNGGRLTQAVILETLARQALAHGLLDERGRGLYMVYRLSGLMFSDLKPGRRSEITAIFERQPNSASPERCLAPLFIFYTE